MKTTQHEESDEFSDDENNESVISFDDCSSCIDE